MRLGGILLVVVVLLVPGQAADLQAQDKAIYEYVDATGEKIIVSDIDFVPEDRRQTIRRLLHDPSESAEERRLDRAVTAAEERKKNPVRAKGEGAHGPEAPAPVCEEEAEWSVLTWLDTYKFYFMVAVVTIVLMFLLPGVKWRGIVGVLSSILVGTLVMEHVSKSASEYADCQPAPKRPNLQQIERELDKSVSDRERRQQERLLEIE